MVEESGDSTEVIDAGSFVRFNDRKDGCLRSKSIRGTMS